METMIILLEGAAVLLMTVILIATMIGSWRN